jgi:hypothetical protein
MHSRSLGGGRRLALLGAIVVIVGCLLPWYTMGGGLGELPVALDGPSFLPQALTYPQGMVVMLAGLGTLALIALPYAMGPRPLAVDRGLAFGILAVVAIVGLVLWVVAVLPAPEGLLPTGAYGYWISVVGGIMLGRAAFEISQEPPRR